MKTFFIATPFGYIALEAGWTVTEVGRQPWIIYGVMKTIDAVTPMPGIRVFHSISSFRFYILIYCSDVPYRKDRLRWFPKLYDPTDALFNDKTEK